MGKPKPNNKILRNGDEKFMRERNNKINIYLNDDEKKILDDKVKKSGLNKSEFFRKIISDYKLKEKPDDRFYEMLYQLRGMANNLNQLALKNNRYSYIDPREYQNLKIEIENTILSMQEVYLLPQKKG